MMRSCAAIFVMLLTMPTFAQKKSDKKEVLLDNDKVEVVRLTYPPGTESGIHGHKHPHRVIYVLEGGELELIDATSKTTKRVTVVKDSVLYVPAATHNVRNVGDTQVKLLEVEIKESN